MLALECYHLNLCYLKSESRIFEGLYLKQTIFSYMALNVWWFSEVSFQKGTPSIIYECHLYLTSDESCIKAEKD